MVNDIDTATIGWANFIFFLRKKYKKHSNDFSKKQTQIKEKRNSMEN